MISVQTAVTPNLSAKESPLQCYSKEGDNTVVKNCSSKAVGCMASWHYDVVNKKVSLINRQGCDDLQGLCEGTNFCESSIKVNSENLWKNNKTTFFQFCCCSSSLCNHEDKLRISQSIDLTSLKLPLPQSPAPAPSHTITTSTAVLDPEQSLQCFSSALAIYSILVTLCFIIVLILSVRKGNLRKLSISTMLNKLKKCFFTRQSKQNMTNQTNRSECKLLSPSSIESDLMSQRTFVEEWKDVTNIQVDINKLFAEGKFGRIYQAFDQNSSKKCCVKVATQPHGQNAFTNEVRILQMLSAAEHNNIIKYYGLHDHNSTTGLVIEYCAKGSLRSFLDASVIKDADLCLSLLNDLALGIAFLHTYNITEPHKQAVVHRDISSDNLLLRSNLCLVIADFGVSTILDETDANNCALHNQPVKAEGTPFYTAPEILNLSIELSNTCSSLKHADVYSMALVMWEIVNRCNAFYMSNENENSTAVPSHSLPYQNEVTTKEELINHVCIQGKRPIFNFLMNEKTASNTTIIINRIRPACRLLTDQKFRLQCTTCSCDELIGDCQHRHHKSECFQLC